MNQGPLNSPPKSYAELFEKTANDAVAWLDSAEGLAAAAEAVKRDDDNTGGARVLADAGTLTRKRGVYAMLLGYAIECALKGLLAKAGNKLGTSTGTLEPRFKTHKLADVANAAGVSVSAAEKETLTWLWCYIEYMGRYDESTRPDFVKADAMLKIGLIDGLTEIQDVPSPPGFGAAGARRRRAPQT